MSRPDRIGKQTQVLCVKCRHMTTHTVRGNFYWCEGEEDDGYWESADNDLLECNGCHTGSYLRTERVAGMPPGCEDVEFFPPRPNDSIQRMPKVFDRLRSGHPLWPAYLQTITALNSQLPTMASAGVRLLVEGVCIQLGVKNGPVEKDGKTKTQSTLEGRINGLHEGGLVSTRQKEALHHIRVAGNDAVHEFADPKLEETSAALTIVEHLLAQVFDQPQYAKRIAAGREATQGPQTSEAKQTQRPGNAKPS